MNNLRRGLRLLACVALLSSQLPSFAAPKQVASARLISVPAVPALPAIALPILAAAPSVGIPAAGASPLAVAQVLAAQVGAGVAAQHSGSSPDSALGAAFDGEHVRQAQGEFFGPLSAGEQAGVVVSRKQLPQAVPGDDEMINNVRESKRTNPEREQAVINLFVRGGAKYDPATAKVLTPDFTRYDEVQIQDITDRRGRPTGKHNIFVFKKGRTDRLIVNSSHNDKVEIGDGVIDNWTGTTLVTHLYQAERGLETEAGRLYIAFGREEEGLLGSLHFLKTLTPEQRAKFDANFNYDTIAIKGGDTRAWEKRGDRANKLAVDASMSAVAQANAGGAQQPLLQLIRASLQGGDSDSSSFGWQKPPIPAMTIFSGPEDLIFSIIHSPRDNFGAFDFLLYKNTFLVAMAILNWVDAHPVRQPRVS